MALGGSSVTGYEKTTSRVVPFDATKFRDSFKGKSPAVSTYFSCSFDKLPNVLSSYSFDGEATDAETVAVLDNLLQTIAYRVFSTDLPSRALTAADRNLTGPGRSIPTGFNYAPLQIEFLESQQYDIRWFFDKWHRAFYSNRASSALSGNNYRVAYYDDLVIPNFYIDLWDKQGNNTASYHFVDVYPAAIYPNQMTWQSSNQVMSVPVELNYYDWAVIKPRWSSTPDTKPPIAATGDTNNSAINTATSLPTLIA